MTTHETKLTDITEHRPGGYGPMGHGVWLVTCSCGFRRIVDIGARNAARRVESDHIGWAATIAKL